MNGCMANKQMKGAQHHWSETGTLSHTDNFHRVTIVVLNYGQFSHKFVTNFVTNQGEHNRLKMPP
jgi:hypothetical protein